MNIKEIEQAAAELETKLAKVNLGSTKKLADINQFCEYWPIVEDILQFAKKMPIGNKAKIAIDFIISWGNQLCPDSLGK